MQLLATLMAAALLPGQVAAAGPPASEFKSKIMPVL